MDVLKIKAKETICDIERAETKRKNLLRYLRLAKERADLADEERDSLKEKIKKQERGVGESQQRNSCKRRRSRS